MADRPETETTGAGLEARLARLEAIVAALEADDLELEEALALFEEGIQHIRHARELLQRAELRVEQLLAAEDGSVILQPFERGQD
jgi:exodeoxyribonuclease VII small subunit